MKNKKPKVVATEKVGKMTVNYTDTFFESMDHYFGWWGRKRECLLDYTIRPIKDWWAMRTRGFTGHMWWNFNDYWARKMLPPLKYLRKNQHGHPGNLTVKEWDKILDKIIWSLDYLGYSRDYKTMQKRNWKKKIKEESIKLQEGLELFGKYYQSLWD